jgi:hypothetical protein
MHVCVRICVCVCVCVCVRERERERQFVRICRESEARTHAWGRGEGGKERSVHHMRTSV